jgi:hypothetical protein
MVIIIDEFPDMVDNDFITRSIMGCGQAQFGSAKTMDATFVLACWLTWQYDRDEKVLLFVDSKHCGVNGIDLVNAIRIEPWVHKGGDWQEKWRVFGFLTSIMIYGDGSSGVGYENGDSWCCGWIIGSWCEFLFGMVRPGQVGGERWRFESCVEAGKGFVGAWFVIGLDVKVLTSFFARNVGFVWAALAFIDVMETKIARFSIRNKEFGLCWHFFEQTGDGGWAFGFLHLPLV